MYNVVLADDNRALTDMLEKTVPWESLGCNRPAVAYNGTEGRSKILLTSPELIISDVEMPGLDGLKMAALCAEAVPGAKLIYISAYDKFDYAVEALRLHSFAYLLKPFITQELIDTVRSAIAELDKERKAQREPELCDVSGSLDEPSSLLVHNFLGKLQ